MPIQYLSFLWLISVSHVTFCFSLKPPSLSQPDTHMFTISPPYGRKVKAVTYCRARCVFVCTSRVCALMRSRALLHRESCGPSLQALPSSLAFSPSQGKSPHAKGKKWGVKGTEFPLDPLLYAPSVPSPCHSSFWTFAKKLSAPAWGSERFLMCPLSLCCALCTTFCGLSKKSDVAL